MGADKVWKCSSRSILFQYTAQKTSIRAKAAQLMSPTGISLSLEPLCSTVFSASVTRSAVSYQCCQLPVECCESGLVALYPEDFSIFGVVLPLLQCLMSDKHKWKIQCFMASIKRKEISSLLIFYIFKMQFKVCIIYFAWENWSLKWSWV